MEQHISLSTRMLNGFLGVMVVVLVGILLAVVVSLILYGFGIL